MVQKQMGRRTSLILGVLLAVLLGVAAGAFVLAMPIRMLETVTTGTGLSLLMVQAEPPISPSDRSLLAILAGILTTGIGWVLVDWLLFGRAGMSTLMRPRDDDFEDEDGDAYRPTDPLDLVVPVALSGDGWPPPSGDTRRPLSARTDIGDPPPAWPPGPAAPSVLGMDRALPPIDQILPGFGAAAQGASSPPPTPSPPAMPQSDPFGLASQGGGARAAPTLDLTDGQLPKSWPPLDDAAVPAASPANNPVWLPAPGVRPDEASSTPVASTLTPEAEPEPASLPGDLLAQSPYLSEMPAVTPEPPVVPPPVGPERTADPLPPAPPVSVFPAMAPAPMPEYHSPSPVPPPVRTATPGKSPDMARLEELLDRLERGLKKRRAGAQAALSGSAPPAPQPIGEPAPIRTLPEPPPGFAMAPPMVEPAATPAETTPPPAPPPAFAAPSVVPAPVAPMTMPSPAAAIPPRAERPAMPSAGNDQLLDQPLHVTLDILRNMVKR